MGIPDRTTVSRNEYLVIGNERKKHICWALMRGRGTMGDGLTPDRNGQLVNR